MGLRILAVGLTVVVAVGATGCKSMPSMAWWKTAKTDDVESTALASAAPELPSEIVKRSEAIVANVATTPTEGQAAPFVPGMPEIPAATTAPTVAAAAPAAYPTTEAPRFAPTTNAVAATQTPATSNLGSIPLPYDPNEVPAAKVAVATPTDAEVGVADRYASTTTTPPAANRYATAAPPLDPATVAASQSVAPPVSNAPATSSPSTNNDRYASVNLAAPAQPPSPAPNEDVLPTPPSPVVAEAAPYRPGGTSQYPTTSAPEIEVATRTQPAAPSVPNVATPSQPSSEASSQRYW